MFTILFLFCFLLPITCYAQKNPDWMNTFGGSLDEEKANLGPTNFRWRIIIGRTISLGAGNTDYFLIKTDSYVNPLWENDFGGSDNEIGFSMIRL